MPHLVALNATCALSVSNIIHIIYSGTLTCINVKYVIFIYVYFDFSNSLRYFLLPFL